MNVEHLTRTELCLPSCPAHMLSPTANMYQFVHRYAQASGPVIYPLTSPEVSESPAYTHIRIYTPYEKYRHTHTNGFMMFQQHKTEAIPRNIQSQWG